MRKHVEILNQRRWGNTFYFFTVVLISAQHDAEASIFRSALAWWVRLRKPAPAALQATAKIGGGRGGFVSRYLPAQVGRRAPRRNSPEQRTRRGRRRLPKDEPTTPRSTNKLSGRCVDLYGQEGATEVILNLIGSLQLDIDKIKYERGFSRSKKSRALRNQKK